MMDPKIFDDIAKRISDAAPPGLLNLQKDAQQNFKTLVASVLSKMDLVTREEFDVQSAVLIRTRTKLEALEKQLAELEKHLTK